MRRSPFGNETSCSAVQPYFEYRPLGETDWQSTAPGHIEAGAWDYSATLDALSMGTTYEYRAVAGNKTGSVLTFDTKPDPVISVGTGAAEPSYTTCTLRASIECREAVQCYFEYRQQGASRRARSYLLCVAPYQRSRTR